MKILLLGEFSGLHKNLKSGLVKLGHDVTIVASGDGWKKIDCDIEIASKYKGFLGTVARKFKYLCVLPKLRGYDVVHVINPCVFEVGIGWIVWKVIRKWNAKVFLSAAGSDLEFIRFGKSGGMAYWPYDDIDDVKLPFIKKWQQLRVHRMVASGVDGIIPIMYEYAEAWRTSQYKNKVLKTIPLCINEKHIDRNFKVRENDKIVIFHGIIDEKKKGSSYIKAACALIKDKYKEKVEIIIDGKMPLEDYLQLMKRVHIVIDQCKSYSYGMNAIYALAQGKIVLSGCEDNCLHEFGLNNSPVINITPSVDDVFDKVDYVIKLGLAGCETISDESFNYVLKLHCSKHVAKVYETAFKEV